MTTEEFEGFAQRQAEIRQAWRDGHEQGVYLVLGGLALVVVGVGIGYALFAGDQGYTVNLYTEIISVVFTVMVLNYFDQQRAKREQAALRVHEQQLAQEQLKAQLVMNAASLSNEVAKDAVHQLRRRGWLEGEQGALRGANLANANLAGASLVKANLRGARLQSATLQGADVSHGNLRNINGFGLNLQDAKLSQADLTGARMRSANLTNANLVFAILRNADLTMSTLTGANATYATLREALLSGADLKGTDLEWANLRGANIREDPRPNKGPGSRRHAEFDETTILPDYTRWTPEVDWARFIDPDQHEHPFYAREDRPHKREGDYRR
jgi:uncharacterized protein YjbI with pentapeptide repeats